MAEKYNINNMNIQLEEDFTENFDKYFKKAVILGSCEEPGYLLGRIGYMREKQFKNNDLSINGMDGHFYKNGLWDEMYTFNLYREPKSFNVDLFLKMRALSSDYESSFFTQDFLTIKSESNDYFRNIIENIIF